MSLWDTLPKELKQRIIKESWQIIIRPASRFKKLNEEYHSKFVANEYDYLQYKNPCRTWTWWMAYNFFWCSNITKEMRCACGLKGEPATYKRILTKIKRPI